MGGHETVLTELVDDLYAAALEPSRWPGVMADVMRLFRGESATLELHDKTTKELLFFEGVNVDDEQQAAYVEHYIDVCPRIGPAIAASEGGVVYDHQFISEHAMDRSEFYQDFLAPYGTRYVAGLNLVQTSDLLGVFGVHRSLREGHVDEEEIRRLQLLMPHMRRALRLAARLTDLELAQGELCAALGELSTGVILFDDHGRVAFMNDAARESLPQTPLRLVDDELRAQSAAQSRRVRRAIAEVLAVHVGERRLPRSLVLHQDAVPHLFQLCPLPSAGRCHAFFAPRAAQRFRAMLVFEASSPATCDDLLQLRYRMTPAEASCSVALAEGASPREIAKTRGVALSTVRTLVTRARNRTGARSQAELVRHVVATGRSRLRGSRGEGAGELE